MKCEFSNGSVENIDLINLLQISICKNLLDEKFTTMWASSAFFNLIGYTQKEFETYQNQHECDYERDKTEWIRLQKTMEEAYHANRSRYKYLLHIHKKNGALIWVKSTGFFSGEYINGYPVAYTICTDVSDIMRDRFERFVDYDDIPALVARYRVPKNLDLKILGANHRFIEFFGDDIMEPGNTLYKRDLEKNLDVLIAHQDELLRGDPVSLVARMDGQYGEDVWLQTSMACVGWEGDDPIYLTIFIDITNETELREMQKKLEIQAEELRVALKLTEQASRAKSDFFSNMSHDIRTPMNAIIGMANIARSHLGDDEKVDHCLKKLLISSQHLLGLINDVLDMSRIESGKMTINPTKLSLPELLENVVAIMLPTIQVANQKFSIRIKKIRHEWFYADALRIRQIFINILSNASKFTPAQGSITIEIEELHHTDSTKAMMCFTFFDTGIGMKEEFLDHLFDAFSRERDSRVDKTEGSGLGMAITKKLIELLDGTIDVHSQLGKGSCFRVILPLQFVEVPIEDVFPDIRILIIDDDQMIGKYLASAFLKHGVHVVSTGSSKEAIEILDKAYQKGQVYKAVFLDWKMPKMNGSKTVRELRLKFGQYLSIIVSAYDWEDIEDEAKASGVDGFISKPLFCSTVYQVLKTNVLVDKSDERLQQDLELQSKFCERRFLLVEDNEINREIAIELLTMAGAEIEYAVNGAEGVIMYEQSEQHYYDLILMDVQMPVMDGYEATRKIRGLSRDDAKTIPILAMTAGAFAKDVAKSMEAGMNGHLIKPLELQTLICEINKALAFEKELV